MYVWNMEGCNKIGFVKLILCCNKNTFINANDMDLD